jgi:NAD(P)-dependent dehydrogenase (short-subunit alcohol dehydrogenase family)
MFTRVLAMKPAPYEITVNAVAPGLIEVPDWDVAPERIDAIVSATPLCRMGQRADVANAVLFLASPASSFITETIVGVGGGALAGRPLPLSCQREAQGDG